MNETPRYATLRDYVRVFRTQRWLILGVTLAFTAAAFLVSALQTKEYTAETSLSFRDLGNDLALVGQQTLPELAPEQRAQVNADKATRREVAERVREALDTKLTADEIQNVVDTDVGSRTSFVIIQATDEDPEFAARLANAYASEVLALDEAQVRKRVDTAIDRLESNLRKIRGSDDQGDLVTTGISQTQIAQLRTVRELARPVEIAKEAEPPDSPSSPRTARNTVLGALVGLAFGLFGAFMRDSLDRRLRNMDEVQAELDLPVIGRVAADALGEAGFANGRVAEAEAHLEGYRLLRTNLEFLQGGTPMKTVMVTSGLPEEGKSTVAMALAGAAAIAGKRTLLVECDLRRPCFADRLGIEERPGLTDYLVGKAAPSDVLQVVKLGPARSSNGDGTKKSRAKKAEDETSLVCITAGSPTPLPAEMLGSDRFGEFLAEVSEAYDLIVLDTAPILSVVDALELAPKVDTMVVCVRLAKTTREEARAASDALSHLPERPTGVVVTGVRAGDDAYYGYSYGDYGRE